MLNSESEVIKYLLEQVEKSDISSIKQVVTEILFISRDKHSSAKDLKNIIERDPPLCAKLLQRANSAYYGYPRSISDIQEAIVCIGFDAVKELALSQKVCELFAREESFNGYNRWALWKHCASVAICCKMIYRMEFRERGDNVYAAGLLHDLGIIVEDQFLPDQFRKALIRMQEWKMNLYSLEKDILLVNHADIGRAIAESWGFPEELCLAMGMHHEPDLLSDEYKRLILTVFVAEYICQEENIGFCDAPYQDRDLLKKCLSELDIKEKAVEIILDELKEEVKRMDVSGWFAT